jgi:hypothetical protein
MHEIQHENNSLDDKQSNNAVYCSSLVYISQRGVYRMRANVVIVVDVFIPTDVLFRKLVN